MGVNGDVAQASCRRAEPSLAVVEVAACDDRTAFSVQELLAGRWATATATANTMPRAPGEAGVRLLPGRARGAGPVATPGRLVHRQARPAVVGAAVFLPWRPLRASAPMSSTRLILGRPGTFCSVARWNSSAADRPVTVFSRSLSPHRRPGGLLPGAIRIRATGSSHRAHEDGCAAAGHGRALRRADHCQGRGGSLWSRRPRARRDGLRPCWAPVVAGHAGGSGVRREASATA
ncbi:DUF6207 family protein [Streptomyces canarius]|uniref:DUF6207 family protein n=1 Tax=Streptomyces TaxID=1883 RepID=UPI003571167C